MGLFRAAINIVEATDCGMEGYDCLDKDEFATIVRLHTPNSVVDKLNGYSRLKDSAVVNERECECFYKAKYLSSPSKAMAALTVKQWNVNLLIAPNWLIFSPNISYMRLNERGLFKP